MNWKKVSECKPPANTEILVLVRGRIFTGMLHSLLLMNHNEPTEFESIYTHDRDLQHTSWGPDSWWAPRPDDIPNWVDPDQKYEVVGG
jgi:hypothetical protein